MCSIFVYIFVIIIFIYLFPKIMIWLLALLLIGLITWIIVRVRERNKEKTDSYTSKSSLSEKKYKVTGEKSQTSFTVTVSNAEPEKISTNKIITTNKYHHATEEIEGFDSWQREQRQIESDFVYNRYFSQMQAIERAWSILYNQKDFSGDHAEQFRTACEENILLYKKMRIIDAENGMKSPPNVPAFKRLAMLFDKQGDFESAARVCEEALNYGANGENMEARLERMIKKTGGNPTAHQSQPVPETIIVEDKENKSSHNSANKNHQPKLTDVPVIVDDNNMVIRTAINNDAIDEAQQKKASDAYENYICNKYYKDYPERPFISLDRELYTNWDTEASDMVFAKQRILPKTVMTRFDDGLLPGHVYMLYWIKFIHRKRIPALFEYRFGIWFTKEKLFLEKQCYIENDSVTNKGVLAIIAHKEVILETSDSVSTEIRLDKLSKEILVDNLHERN